jgi:hypothetical protein
VVALERFARSPGRASRARPTDGMWLLGRMEAGMPMTEQHSKRPTLPETEFNGYRRLRNPYQNRARSSLRHFSLCKLRP